MNETQPPTPADVRSARESFGVTQAQAAAMLCTGLQSYQRYETDGAQSRRIHAGLWALFRARLALHVADRTTALAVLEEGLPSARP